MKLCKKKSFWRADWSGP